MKHFESQLYYFFIRKNALTVNERQPEGCDVS